MSLNTEKQRVVKNDEEEINEPLMSKESAKKDYIS